MAGNVVSYTSRDKVRTMKFSKVRLDICSKVRLDTCSKDRGKNWVIVCNFMGKHFGKWTSASYIYFIFLSQHSECF
jgi:hypothetical protein